MNDASKENRGTPLINRESRFEDSCEKTPGAGTTGPLRVFADQYVPLEGGLSAQHVISALLKHPAKVVCEIIQGNRKMVSLILLLIVVLCMFGYGLVMGMFSGGHQLWFVPLKVCFGLLLASVICLPSLYIFICLAGGDQSLSQVTGLLLAMLALGGILLVGFAPVAWVFSQATNASKFMGSIHLVFWGLGVLFGLRLLESALVHLNRCNAAVFRTWAVIFIMVVLQMTTTLRPLVGEYQGAQLFGKKFFLHHWGNPNKEVSRNTVNMKNR
jgi:hypothetical protein